VLGKEAIGYNIRGYAAVKFFEAAKQPRSHVNHRERIFDIIFSPQEWLW